MREVLRRRAALHIKERTILLRAFAKVPRVALLQLLHQCSQLLVNAFQKGRCRPAQSMSAPTASTLSQPSCLLLLLSPTNSLLTICYLLAGAWQARRERDYVGQGDITAVHGCLA